MILDMFIFLSAVEPEVVIDAAVAPDMYEKLLSMTVEEIVHAVATVCASLAFKFLKVALIWIVGRWIMRKVVRMVKKIMLRRNVNPSISSFVSSLIDVVSLAVIIIMIISVLGIDTSSFIALFASAGVAVGMALSGTLQNFAGGVMILLFRPFKVGDFIEAQGVAGTVREIQIFNTLVHTGDNKVILLPNGPVSTGIINNYSREDVRRVDMVFSISYGDDFEKAKEVLLRIIKEDERILDTPSAPAINLMELAASSIDISVKVWCKQSDYWNVKFDMNRNVYDIFPKEGLNFPYQTLTLHVEKEA